MNTKDDNIQETLDLPMEESEKDIKTAQEKPKKKPVTVKKKTTKTNTKKNTATEKAEKKVKVETKPKKKINTTEEKKEDASSVDIETQILSETVNDAQSVDVAGAADDKPLNEIRETPDQDKRMIIEETEIPVQSQEPIVEDIKRRKLFFVSDMDEEAIYLHDMSLQGYHFISKKGMQYTFRQGEPKNYFYHLGYYEKDKRDGERYLDNYTEAGWENIFHEKGEFDGVWNYFRIEMPVGEEEPNIFSDRVSRLALYKRLLSSWRTLLAVDIICFILTIFFYIFLSNHPSKTTGLFITLASVLFITLILIFIVYIRAYLKISRKQEELRNL